MSLVEEMHRSPGFYLVPSSYVPAGTDELAKVGLWPNEQMASVIQSYDPEREALVVFVHLSGKWTCYRFEPPDLQPPAAYKQWREDNPIGVRLNPNWSPAGVLRQMSRYELEQKKRREAEFRAILSDPAKQWAFLAGLVEGYQSLRKELESGGVAIDASGHAYPLEQPGLKPGTAFDRLRFHATVASYLATATALNDVLLIYNSAPAGTDHWVREATKAGLEALEDRTTVLMTFMAAQDWGPEPDLQLIFLYLATARIRAHMRPELNSRLSAAINRAGGSFQDVLLDRIAASLLVAWARYIERPRSPRRKDANELVTLVSNEIAGEELEPDHQSRLAAQRRRRDAAAISGISGSDASCLQNDFELRPSPDRLMAELAARKSSEAIASDEARIDIERLTGLAGISFRGEEVLKGLLAGKDGPTIAKETGLADSTVRATKHQIIKKLRRAAGLDEKPKIGTDL